MARLLICMYPCVQLSCVLVARNTRSVPQCVVITVGSPKSVKSLAAVWPVVTVPPDCCGAWRANVCLPACAPVSLKAAITPLAWPPPRKTAATGKNCHPWTKRRRAFERMAAAAAAAARSPWIAREGWQGADTSSVPGRCQLQELQVQYLVY